MSLYTTGNWSVEQLTTDSITTPKDLSIVDLDYSNDFTVVSEKPTEVILANTTGEGFIPVEHIRYGRRPLADIYGNFPDVASGQRTPVKDGYRCMTEVKYLLKATNTVSGQEILLPFRSWISYDIPMVDFVKPQAVELLVKRTIASAFATGKVDDTMIVDIARGDLNPKM
jgi:hypothetical protein